MQRHDTVIYVSAYCSIVVRPRIQFDSGESLFFCPPYAPLSNKTDSDIHSTIFSANSDLNQNRSGILFLNLCLFWAISFSSIRSECNCCEMENKRRHWWAAIPAEDMSWWIQMHSNRPVVRVYIYLSPVTMNAQISRQHRIHTLFFDCGIIRAMDACGNLEASVINEWILSGLAPLSDIFQPETLQHSYLVYRSPLSIVSCVMGALAFMLYRSCSACPGYGALQ